MHALLSPFHPAASLSSHLAPSTPCPVQAKETLWMSLCKHKATCYFLSLDCASVFAVLCPSTIHYQHGPPWILIKIRAHTTFCFTQPQKLQVRQYCLRSSGTYFQICIQQIELYKFEELFTIILLNWTALYKHITSSTAVRIGKWYDMPQQLSKDIIWFQWISQYHTIRQYNMVQKAEWWRTALLYASRTVSHTVGCRPDECYLELMEWAEWMVHDKWNIDGLRGENKDRSTPMLTDKMVYSQICS